jgi:hypothetical protein
LEKPKVLALVVYLPVNLAVEIYRESGNLAMAEFPNTLKFAESIAEALDPQHIENIEKESVEFSYLPKSEEKTTAKSKRKRQ